MHNCITEVAEIPKDKEMVPKVTVISVEVDKSKTAEPNEEKAPKIKEIVKEEKKKKENSPVGKLNDFRNSCWRWFFHMGC